MDNESNVTELKPTAPVADVTAQPDPSATKERIREIAAELTKASPSGVESLAGELASLVESL